MRWRMSRPSLYDFSYDELSNLLNSWGEPNYRSSQIWKGLYDHIWLDIDLFYNLPGGLRNRLGQEFELMNLSLDQQQISKDGSTEKCLFTLHDGLKIETVLMKYAKRQTVCISTQAGCAMGCTFCATGQMGFFRNLTSGEIVQQVIYFHNVLKNRNQTITNVVMMGMGEPFHNYDQVIKAIYQLNHSAGMKMGARRFTISTVGLVPIINRFTLENHQINLAVSLHATKDERRSELIPVARKYPLDELIQSCLNYVRKTGRRITFEWALIEGVNDSVIEANQLADLLVPFIKNGGSLCHVNVIPLNPTLKFSGNPSTSNQAEKFCEVLRNKKIPCSVRLRRGIDIQAGCGQLAGSYI